MVSFRFQHCLIPFTMLLVEGFSETQLFRYLSNNVFRNPKFPKYISYEDEIFVKLCKILSTFENAAENSEKASELSALICLYWEEKTFDQQSMCSQTVRRFCILLRDTFSNSITFTVINKYAEGAVAQISTVFGLVYHVAFGRIFRSGTF